MTTQEFAAMFSSRHSRGKRAERRLILQEVAQAITAVKIDIPAALQAFDDNEIAEEESYKAWERACALCEKHGHKWVDIYGDGRDLSCRCARCGEMES